jgi:hypothetical protein
MTESSTHNHAPLSNPDVRFEPTDVEARSVIVFVASLTVMLVVLSVALVGMYNLLEYRESNRKKTNIPLAETERNRLPEGPRLEGIDPREDTGRAWVDSQRPGVPHPWFGYNVLIVPQEGHNSDTDADAEHRDRLAMEAVTKRLKKVDETLSALAGKLPVRPKAEALPRDEFRRSTGKGNAGRGAGEGVP